MVRRVTIYTACTADGLISGTNHELDWLFTEKYRGSDLGFSEFLNGIDVTIMGRNTYEFSKAYGPVFPGKKNYVFSRTLEQLNDDSVQLVHENPIDFVKKTKLEPGKNIWIVGGSCLNSELLDAGLVDDLILTIHPVFLGSGIALCNGLASKHELSLLSCNTFTNGLVQLFYQVKNELHFQKAKGNSIRATPV
ncbi:hypothetical protein MDAP_001430 [Mitosporidium daphniae]|uniref:2,5-diamino-6-ribosylamino-4(3H)-pyrimidinone 5'-phosphate reductase n=1 Tax=Mitosporidium daphniae TaxID=1485682 RepID=A0A098VPD7_9MICR|nr:bifunctional deaminase-reductase domain protein [Mitosporidium daphniae]KGG50902.1 bifunctional deaminase-reductase domain protein [Mitosporidium daphniae]|eukprot:XP_013237348.1 bifunctional deaminase-reductase domain protein [Mitosporidium daphniae]